MGACYSRAPKVPKNYKYRPKSVACDICGAHNANSVNGLIEHYDQEHPEVCLYN